MTVQFLPSLLSWPLHAFYLFSFLPQGHSLALSDSNSLCFGGAHRPSHLPAALLTLLLKALSCFLVSSVSSFISCLQALPQSYSTGKKHNSTALINDSWSLLSLSSPLLWL